MPTAVCAGGCPRLISISAVPGGNPQALLEPEAFASEWARCDACARYTCDRCLARLGGRCGCGRPARLFSPQERVRVAQAMAQGAPRPPAANAQAAGSALAAQFSALGTQIDASLHRGDSAQASALAWHAAGTLTAPAFRATREELSGLLGWGDQYFRWELWDAGTEFWRALHAILASAGVDPASAERASAMHDAMLVLSGRANPASPHAVTALSKARRVFGDDHVLTRRVAARVQSLGDPAVDALTPAQQTSLWLALALLHLGNADGQLSREELAVYDPLLARHRLPEVRDRFGPERLFALLSQGYLQRLSELLASTATDATRATLVASLLEVVTADGRVDPRELGALQRVAGWCKVALSIAPTVAAPPAEPRGAPPGTLRRVGFFRERASGDPRGPSLREAMRPEASPHRDQLVAYLRGAPVFIACMGRVVDVLDSARGRVGTGSICTDGVWAWPDDLPHYIERYNVALPEAFFEHARARQWTPVAESALDLKRLTLPEEETTAPPAPSGAATVLVLDDVGRSKIAVIKEIRDVSLCGLADAKALSEATLPRIPLRNPKITPEEALRRFTAAGARARLAQA
ncbi:MAG: ribosomal protein L7/L12 [Deltaproteobacteria bacterium]|nr:ribosomal protein L7/L12 [Deltaproteobacteria bacterium]